MAFSYPSAGLTEWKPTLLASQSGISRPKDPALTILGIPAFWKPSESQPALRILVLCEECT